MNKLVEATESGLGYVHMWLGKLRRRTTQIVDQFDPAGVVESASSNVYIELVKLVETTAACCC